jgi:hypothetical protein
MVQKFMLIKGTNKRHGTLFTTSTGTVMSLSTKSCPTTKQSENALEEMDIMVRVPSGTPYR